MHFRTFFIHFKEFSVFYLFYGKRESFPLCCLTQAHASLRNAKYLNFLKQNKSRNAKQAEVI